MSDSCSKTAYCVYIRLSVVRVNGPWIETNIETGIETVVKTIQTIETVQEGVKSNPLPTVSMVCMVFTTVSMLVSMPVSI